MRRTFLAFAALAAVAPFASAFAQNCDTSFSIVNQTSMVVREIYIDSSALPNYTVDRLGANVLQPGQSFNVRPSEGGLYDIRIVMMNNASAELRQVNVCEVSTVRVTDSGLTAE